MQLQFFGSHAPEGETTEISSLQAQHEAYLEALRSHAGLLRDLDRTMRGIGAALDEAGIEPARRAALSEALDTHIERARASIAAIDHRLTLALGGPAARH